jgi:hypothetical protein
MKKRVGERLTFANVIACIALFVALGGASYAAIQVPKNSVGTKQLKRNAVTASKIRRNAVTSTKIKRGAITAKLLGANSVGNSQTELVKVLKGPGAVSAAADEASAPKIPIGSVGPFSFYGKCFLTAGKVQEKTYIELTSGVATLGSEDGAELPTPATQEYLTPTTLETKRAMEDDAIAEANKVSAVSNDEEFQATATNGTQITGLIGGTGAKQGSPPIGDGPFLAGNSCLVGIVAIFGS